MRCLPRAALAALVPITTLLLAAEAPRAGERGAPAHGRQARLAEDVRAALAREGIEPLPAPPPVSDALFELGRALAFDKLLSGNRNIACLTCHHPTLATGDARHLPRGEGGVGLGEARSGGPVIPRNAPPLFNLHTFDSMFWDSRVELAEDGTLLTPAGDQLTAEMVEVLSFGVIAAQALFPVTSREEMRGQPGSNEVADLDDGDFQGIWSALMRRLGAIPAYVELFEAAYPGERFDDMSFAHAANAIAAFEVAAFDARGSPWERFVAGDDSALSVPELRGALEFFDAGCTGCHAGSRLSDFRHHDTGLAQIGPGKGDGPDGRDDFGRERVTGDPGDRYAFRTPPLHNVALTGPYGHAGEFGRLRAHVQHYIDPEASLLDYRIERHVAERALWPSLLDNRDDVLAWLAPELGALAFPRPGQVRARRIARFLEALTDPSAASRPQLVPASVPSGLPVAD
jgi:cytochrome c peroxidase